MLTEESLSQFYGGTQDYHLFNNMSRNVVATDGAMHVAKEGGAYWLLEAIASHIVTNPKLRSGRLGEMQFWRLESTPIPPTPQHKVIGLAPAETGRKEWKLTCREDDGIKPAVTQEIEWSDFPLNKIDLWVAPSQLGDKMVWVIYLPIEH